MAKVVFTPWKNKSQLLEVRAEFYPSPSYEGPDLRSHACALVEAWKLRGNIPHHVEATALLTDAILHDDVQRNSIFSIRATYSAAFCRFVTGLVDTKIHGQRRTMFQRAMDQGLPASFVELRHEATHREPPSLIVLRKASQRSLEWLWHNYWAEIDSTALPVENGEGFSVKTALDRVLRQCSTASEPSKKRKRDHDSVSSQLIAICDSLEGDSVRILASTLVEGYFFDSNREFGDSLQDSFRNWDSILQKVTQSHPTFLTYLTEELIHGLVFADDSPVNAQSEARYEWLSHLLSAPSWESQRHIIPRGYILTACNEHPNHWSKKLGDRLRESEKKTIESQYAAAATSQEKSVQNGSVVSDEMVKLREHGWGYIEKWDSRPLGIASN
ncbi:hypothetical protein N7495_001797 [Penicillium taxi]|uniref:uncharacterized protein n=1 Tax=Penicillium taxi TaxID=168475 RepID=UPI002545BCC8|nr:uncharacterized protein N7495_001797 [Penicillium taxi]KAJ5909115.1 hypothetical protein N7495_001797 [Penicillium taxi]